MKQIAKAPITLVFGIALAAISLAGCAVTAKKFPIVMSEAYVSPVNMFADTGDFDADLVAIFTPVSASLDNDVFDGEQQICMALNLYFEARNQPEDDAIALGYVVLNRVKDTSKRFKDTVCGVVKQGSTKRYRCEFSWHCDGKSDKPRDAKAWDRAFALADAVLTHSAKDETQGALYYHAVYVKPYWAKLYTRVAQFGDHILYVSN